MEVREEGMEVQEETIHSYFLTPLVELQLIVYRINFQWNVLIIQNKMKFHIMNNI